MSTLVHLHIPHTGGRTLGRCIWVESLPMIKVHNAKEIADLPTSKPLIFYWVLREPVERCLGEFLHYTVVYSKGGRVNHLSSADGLGEIQDPRVYFSLEVNRNVMCKFLLRRTDFSIPLSEEEYQRVVELVQTKEYVFDRFGRPTEYVQLSRLLACPQIKLDQSYSYSPSVVRDKAPLYADGAFLDFLREVQAYDLRLYHQLS